ncbi:hypothetical protein RB595_006806 [Gaeumannomyces hyphopodioides]
MGLALYNPTDSMADLKDDRQEPTPASQPRVSPKRRDHAARQYRYGTRVDFGDLRQRLSDRHGTALQAAHWLHRYSQPAANDGVTRTLPVSSPRTRPRSRLAWTAYVQEGAELAMPHSTPVPHIQPPRRDRSRDSASTENATGRTRRPPSLERQEAFRAPGTSTPPRRRSGSDDDSTAVDAGGDGDFEAVEAEDIADLYELGLLYEDEHLRGAGFGFEALAGQQYTLDLRRVAQRSRARRRKAPSALERRQYGGSPFLGRGGHVFRDDLPLEDGSMRPLAEHSDGISNFLISPDAGELYDDFADDFDLVSIPPDADMFPDLVSDTDDFGDDDGKSSSDWVVMSDSEREPASRTQ